mmetsp:Transcript_26542/g.66491  ORF Transcript_26542/g.66491 Transcript_26542/m.66491 type:complete len:223 (-) Transcript_26542:123-791(-)
MGRRRGIRGLRQAPRARLRPPSSLYCLYRLRRSQCHRPRLRLPSRAVRLGVAHGGGNGAEQLSQIGEYDAVTFPLRSPSRVSQIAHALPDALVWASHRAIFKRCAQSIVVQIFAYVFIPQVRVRNGGIFAPGSENGGAAVLRPASFGAASLLAGHLSPTLLFHLRRRPRVLRLHRRVLLLAHRPHLRPLRPIVVVLVYVVTSTELPSSQVNYERHTRRLGRC